MAVITFDADVVQSSASVVVIAREENLFDASAEMKGLISGAVLLDRYLLLS